MKHKLVLKKGRIQLGLSNRAYKKGKPPGTIDIPKGETGAPPTPGQINLIRITPQSIKEDVNADWNTIKKEYNKNDLFWINFEGLKDEELIKDVGQFFKIAPLALEDITTTDQRPKMEDHNEYLLFILRMFHIENNSKKVHSEQVSFILGNNFLLSFQEGPPGDVFDQVRTRLRKSTQAFVKWKTDYLFYALVDSIIDNYFVIMDSLFEDNDEIETELIHKKNPQIIEKIYEKKIEVIFFRRFVSPLRDSMAQLLKSESPLIQTSTKSYLVDMQDHLWQISESIDSFRDIISFMAEFALSLSTNTTNDVIKFLTIFTSIFSPLTFIVGIYGMNFEYFPELKWRLGYPMTLVAMLAITIGLLFYFRKRKWL